MGGRGLRRITGLVSPTWGTARVGCLAADRERREDGGPGTGPQAAGIGTPDDMRAHLRAFQDAGVDQVIFMQQAGKNRHDHICQSLELFANEVMPGFKSQAAARESRKARDLAPFIEAALKRKPWMKPLADHEIPIVKASVAKAQVNQSSTA